MGGIFKIIYIHQGMHQNGWKGLGTIFNSLVTYQVLQPIERKKKLLLKLMLRK